MNCRQMEQELASGDISSRQGLLDHLDDCERCRELWTAGGLLAEVGGLERDLESLRDVSLVAPAETMERRAVGLVAARAARPSTPRWVWGAAAAGLLLVAVGTSQLVRTGPGGRVDRVGDLPVMRGNGSGAPRPVAPVGELLAGDRLIFSWTHAREPDDAIEALRYRLVAIDVASGETVFERVVTGFELELAGDERSWVEPGRRYHWVVDPLGQGDGQPSPSTAFWIRPR